MSEGSGNGWDQYQKLVLKQLEDHGQQLCKIEKQLRSIEIALAVQRVKIASLAAVAGVIGGAAAGAIAKVILR
jgi:hypothetical protein